MTLAGSAFAARRRIREGGFDVVIGTGGYASAPAVLGGRFARRPTVLLEPNAEAGLANRWASRFADAAAVAYEASASRLKCLSWVTGVPVRGAFFEIPPLRADGKPRLLVLGGSQGSLRINRLMPEVLAPLFDRLPELSVLHQCGEAHLEATLAAYRAAGLDTPRLRVVAFVDNTPAAMAAVDLVVSRAGAITLAEICAAGRPAVLLPLLAGGGHQVANARLLADAGAASLIEDVALDADRLRRRARDAAGRPRTARADGRERPAPRPSAALPSRSSTGSRRSCRRSGGPPDVPPLRGPPPRALRRHRRRRHERHRRGPAAVRGHGLGLRPEHRARPPSGCGRWAWRSPPATPRTTSTGSTCW